MIIICGQATTILLPYYRTTASYYYQRDVDWCRLQFDWWIFPRFFLLLQTLCPINAQLSYLSDVYMKRVTTIRSKPQTQCSTFFGTAPFYMYTFYIYWFFGVVTKQCTLNDLLGSSLNAFFDFISYNKICFARFIKAVSCSCPNRFRNCEFQTRCLPLFFRCVYTVRLLVVCLEMSMWTEREREK